MKTKKQIEQRIKDLKEHIHILEQEDSELTKITSMLARNLLINKHEYESIINIIDNANRSEEMICKREDKLRELDWVLTNE